MNNKDSIPLYSGYEEEETKSSNLYKVITNILKVIIFVVAIFVIGFAAAWGTFAATYYFTAQNEKPSNLMDESCFIQIPFRILKNVQRELSVQSIIEDDMFPNNYDVLITIASAYDKKAEKFAQTFTKQVEIRQSYYSPDPTIILATVYFFSTLFALILRCLPFYNPEFIYPPRERKIIQIKQFFRAVVYTYIFAMYSIGVYKLVNVLNAVCSTYF